MEFDELKIDISLLCMTAINNLLTDVTQGAAHLNLCRILQNKVL